MSWNKKLLLSTALFIFSGAACAEKITCPNTLPNALITHRLNDASLFQGPPEKQGELMPDNDNRMVWTRKSISLTQRKWVYRSGWYAVMKTPLKPLN